MGFRPSVSIIIAVKNAQEGLRRSLESIRLQQYESLETIVIDGGSTDGSVALINANKDVITQYISERDAGISDAFNKGLKLATGDYIYFLGAGDTFIDPLAMTKLFHDLDASYQLVCGKILRVKEDGSTPLWSAPESIRSFNKRSLLFKMSLPHQGLFTHRDFFKRYGDFDTSVKFAMDYELLLRAYHDFPKTAVKDVMVARWQAGGIGTHRIIDILDEYTRIKLHHRVAPKALLMTIDRWNRLKYYVKTKFFQRTY